MKEMIKRWEDLTINQYLEIFEILDTDESEIDKNIKVVSVILDIPYDELLEMPITEVSGYVNQLVFLKHTPTPNKLKKTYTLLEKEYTIFKDYKKLTTSQYIDFQSYAGDLEKNIKEILSIILIPKGCEYGEGYDTEELRKIIGNELSLGDGLALISFFGKSLRKSIKTSLVSSLTLLKKTMKRMKKTDKETYEKITQTLDSSGYHL